MFRKVEFMEKLLNDHMPYAGEDRIAEIRRLAESLGNLRVLHVNSTSYGGGVAELLYTIVPLMRDAGLDAEWHVIDGVPDEFFDVTKKIHNSLQGAQTPLGDREWCLYEDVNMKLAKAFPRGPWDVVIIHDPQPLAVLAFLDSVPESERPVVDRWFWRCHIDLSTPLDDTWHRLWPYVNEYDGAIVTSRAYARDEIAIPVAEITPSTDPTSPKNLPIPEDEARQMMVSFGIATDRPLIVQVSRFDPWKDPFGVVESYRILKKKWPDLQLAMVGSIAADDPEGIGILAKLKEDAEEDGDIHVLSNEDGVGAREVAGFQQCADVVIQKSTREGFGLTITEAMWKGRPVVAGNATGCKLQISDGEDGFIVKTTEQCAARIDEILEDPDLGARLGEKARETVRRRFLSTQHVMNYLNLFAGRL
ncbi:MAG TPA: glycosyl transferase family 1 [Firmicutes bacterium]|jgi:trehalose synthase|nr:glycosyltransferase [Bacillota bacterium]HAN87142.1 glycosyl transferase family 1 [Bacillota bacterium]